MYKIDSNLIKIGNVKNFNYFDFGQNATKFCKFEDFGCDLILGEAPDNQATQSNPRVTSSFYLLSKTGIELCKVDEHFLSCVRAAFVIYGIKMRDVVVAPQSRHYQVEAKEAKFKAYSILCEPIIAAAAKDPNLIEHIPNSIFQNHPELSDKLLMARENQHYSTPTNSPQAQTQTL